MKKSTLAHFCWIFSIIMLSKSISADTSESDEDDIDSETDNDDDDDDDEEDDDDDSSDEGDNINYSRTMEKYNERRYCLCACDGYIPYCTSKPSRACYEKCEAQCKISEHTLTSNGKCMNIHDCTCVMWYDKDPVCANYTKRATLTIFPNYRQYQCANICYSNAYVYLYDGECVGEKVVRM